MKKKVSKKTHYHSTVSRRDFMKTLGFGAGAVGLSAVGATKSFADLDEMLDSPLAERKLPFWIKEVDEPTVEINWDIQKPYQLFNMASMGAGFGDKKLQAKNIAHTTQQVKDNVPGYSLRDRALSDANCWGWAREGDVSPSWTGPDVKPFEWEHPTVFYTPKDYGVPKYNGTPEENSRMLRVAGRVLGAADMGFVKLDDRTKKLLYSNILFENVEQGYVKNRFALILPDKDLWVICALIPQSLWMARYTDRMSWASSNTSAYSRANIYSNRIKVFLRGLGYQHYGGHTVTLGRAVGFGVMSGLAEYGRAGIMVSPQFGANFRTVMLTVTDLPLAVTKPIDAGITNFCKICKKCAEMCPSGAISMEDEPFWGGEEKWQAEGIKGWYQQGNKCSSYMVGGEPDCSRCQTVCPFTKYDQAVMHDLVRMSISKAPVLNSILKKMDDVFGYGKEPDPNKTPWDLDPMDIPLYGLDDSRTL